MSAWLYKFLSSCLDNTCISAQSCFILFVFPQQLYMHYYFLFYDLCVLYTRVCIRGGGGGAVNLKTYFVLRFRFEIYYLSIDIFLSLFQCYVHIAIQTSQNTYCKEQLNLKPSFFKPYYYSQ